MVGLLTVIFMQKGYALQVNHIAMDTVKCGLGNQLGNKGAILVQL